MITLYGINNCDSVRRARRWLERHGIDYVYHDVRTDGVSQTLISQWAEKIDWQKLLNRRGTTWRRLSAEQRNTINKSRAIDLMVEHPTLIKRPVVDTGRQTLLGFNETEYRQILT